MTNPTDHRQTANDLKAAIFAGPTHGAMTSTRNFFHTTSPERFVGFADWCKANADALESDPTWGCAAADRIRYTWARMATEVVSLGGIL